MCTRPCSLRFAYSLLQLLEFVLLAATRPPLIVVTLETLQRFILWIPTNFIFETSVCGQ